jgi:ubiquinone biosynthesis protein
VRGWIERNLGPIGKIEELGRGAVSLAGLVGHLPEIVSRAEVLAETLQTASEKGFPLDQRSIAEIGRAEARRNRWGNAALWVIALTVVYLAGKYF